MMRNLINNESPFAVNDEQTHQAEEDLYSNVYVAPIFDVYDNGEPSMAVLHAAMKEVLIAICRL